MQPVVKFQSCSSFLMSVNTVVRNTVCPPLLAVVVSEVGYGVTAIGAIAESALATVALVFTRVFCGRETIEKNVKWLDSSLFCILWAIADLCFYNFMIDGPLIVNESAARESAKFLGMVYPEGTQV